MGIKDAIMVENVKLKLNRSRIICYSSDYSYFQHSKMKKFQIPTSVKYLYYPLELTHLDELQNNHVKLGKVKCYLTPLVKRQTRNGTNYQLALSDGEKNGTLHVSGEQKQKLNLIISESGSYELEGIYHTKYDMYRIETDRFNIKKITEEISPKYINPQEIELDNSLVCLGGQLIDIYEPEDFVYNNGKKEQIHRVRFSCSEVTMNLSALKKKTRKN